MLEFITDLSDGLLCCFDFFLEVNAHGLPVLARNPTLVLLGRFQSFTVGIEFGVSFAESVHETLCILLQFTISEFVARLIGRFHLSTFDGLVRNLVKIACHLDE